jgi:hypothetical protein
MHGLLNQEMIHPSRMTWKCGHLQAAEHASLPQPCQEPGKIYEHVGTRRRIRLGNHLTTAGTRSIIVKAVLPTTFIVTLSAPTPPHLHCLTVATRNISLHDPFNTHTVHRHAYKSYKERIEASLSLSTSRSGVHAVRRSCTRGTEQPIISLETNLPATIEATLRRCRLSVHGMHVAMLADMVMLGLRRQLRHLGSDGI